jgi:hypothetical protein
MIEGGTHQRHVLAMTVRPRHGDIVLIPVDQVDEAAELLRQAGHRVIG